MSFYFQLQPQTVIVKKKHVSATTPTLYIRPSFSKAGQHYPFDKPLLSQGW